MEEKSSTHSSCTSVPLHTPFYHIIIVQLQELYLFALPISHLTLPPVQWHSAMQLERYQIEMLVGYHWLTCCCHFDEQCILLHFVILCDIPTLIVPYSSCSHISIFFAKGSYFNLNAKPANPSLALHHNLMDLPPTCINSSRAVTSGLLGLNNT